MSYRRSNDPADSKKAWREFRSAVTPHLDAAGISIQLLESKHRFDLFLMHGADDSAGVHLPAWSKLPEHQRAALIAVCAQYFQAGFEDPGVAVIGPQDLLNLKA